MSVAHGANIGIYSILPLYLTKELTPQHRICDALLGIRLGGSRCSVVWVFWSIVFSLGRSVHYDDHLGTLTILLVPHLPLL